MTRATGVAPPSAHSPAVGARIIPGLLTTTALRARVDVHRLAAQEADQRQPRLLRPARRRATTARTPRRAAGSRPAPPSAPARTRRARDTSSAQPAQRQLVLQQRPADDLVDRVVPPHVLAHREQLAGGGEQPRRVQPAGGGEHPLRVAQPVGQRGQHGGREDASVGGQRRRGSTQMSSIEVLPQTPQADVVMKFRRALGVTADARRERDVDDVPDLVRRCGRGARSVVPSQTFIAAMSSRPRTIASPTRKPAASSTSSPGVRIVMVSAVPSTRMPSGSSAASRSARVRPADAHAGPLPPSARVRRGTVTRSTRRRAVRPATAPPPPRLPSISGYAGAGHGRGHARPGGCARSVVPQQAKLVGGR